MNEIFDPAQIRIADYDYNLPNERIAKYPLPKRDSSQLLVYNNGVISDKHFYDLPKVLPAGAMLVFNNTRVVPARMFFTKDTGAMIEVFCMEPFQPNDYVMSFAATQSVSWRCVVGNSKKWKGGLLSFYNPLNDPALCELDLKAECLDKEQDTSIVRFTWKTDCSFAELMDHCGKVPIPPYLNREAESSDTERYQTVYAAWRGSVAAPTAGLHFTPEVLQKLKEQNIPVIELTLHVGAGTFKPVKSERIGDHIMHSEPFSMTRDFLQKLHDHKGPVVAVGTTSCRCLESLYPFATQILRGIKPEYLPQWEAYHQDVEMSFKQALEVIMDYMDNLEIDSFHARTRIMIAPSFRFRCIDALVTNYHQPQSTLLLLIAALIGPKWKMVYEHAMSHSYRFLSYGDSSLLYKSQID